MKILSDYYAARNVAKLFKGNNRGRRSAKGEYVTNLKIDQYVAAWSMLAEAYIDLIANTTILALGAFADDDDELVEIYVDKIRYYIDIAEKMSEIMPGLIMKMKEAAVDGEFVEGVEKNLDELEESVEEAKITLDSYWP
ncbi:MAG: hypothetical protein OXI44_11015 [Bacteroidota bacterium]|nr:hypothetical protein [Bacteroidota bacterium]